MQFNLNTQVGNGKHYGSTIKEVIDIDPFYFFNYLKQNSYNEEVHLYFSIRCPQLSYIESIDELLSLFLSEEDKNKKILLACRIHTQLDKSHPLYKEIIRLAHL